MTIYQMRMLKTRFQVPRSIEYCLKLNQTLFGSLCYHRWVAYNAERDAFERTLLGDAELTERENFRLERRHNTQQFSKRVHIRRRGLHRVA